MRPIILAMLTFAATPALAVDFPIHANNLVPGERVVTRNHAPGGGEQVGAKDLRVLRWLADNNWQRLKQGTTDNDVPGVPNVFNLINANYLIYSRPIFAMAGGTVVGCWRNAPENIPPNNHPQVTAGKILLGGNHVWIKQADGNIALYAHAIPGSIPASLCPHNAQFLTGTAVFNVPNPAEPEAVVIAGATVTAGQMLGSIGNSGNSSEPHLHVHMVDSTNSSQTMKFARGQTTPFPGNTASLNGPWTGLQGNALPAGPILIWPPHPIGNWTFNGIEGSAFQRVFDHFVDSGMMANTITCHNDGASYDSTWVPAQGSWIAHHHMTFAEFTVTNATLASQGFKQASLSICGSHVAAIWRK